MRWLICEERFNVTDLEQGLRGELAERVRELETPPSVGLAGRVVARRRRRAGVASFAVVACLATLAGTLLRSGEPAEELVTAPSDAGTKVARVWSFEQPEPPAPAAAPPALFVAVTRDGRLVVVETATGKEVRQLAAQGDPTDPFTGEGPGPNVIDAVALSPNGEDVWYSECCEPAGGSLFRVPLDGSADGLSIESHPGYSPVVSLDGRYVALTTGTGVHIADMVGSETRIFENETWYGSYQELAWSPDAAVMAVRTGMPHEPGELLLLDPSTFRFGDEEASPGADGRQVPGDGWALPAFDREGRLVVAERDGDLWRGRIIDPATQEVVESFDYGGRPIAQDFDPTGEWLLFVLADGVDGSGVVHRRGPDGSTGTIPGRYRTASW